MAWLLDCRELDISKSARRFARSGNTSFHRRMGNTLDHLRSMVGRANLFHPMDLCEDARRSTWFQRTRPLGEVPLTTDQYQKSSAKDCRATWAVMTAV